MQRKQLTDITFKRFFYYYYYVTNFSESIMALTPLNFIKLKTFFSRSYNVLYLTSNFLCDE